MPVAKVAITMDEELLHQVDALVSSDVFPNRSKAIQAAVEAQLKLLRREALVRECAKLSIVEEQKLAEEGLEAEAGAWPAY